MVGARQPTLEWFPTVTMVESQSPSRNFIIYVIMSFLTLSILVVEHAGAWQLPWRSMTETIT